MPRKSRTDALGGLRTSIVARRVDGGAKAGESGESERLAGPPRSREGTARGPTM